MCRLHIEHSHTHYLPEHWQQKRGFSQCLNAQIIIALKVNVNTDRSCQTWQPLYWANTILLHCINFGLVRAVTHASNRRSRPQVSSSHDWPEFHWWMWHDKGAVSKEQRAALETTLLSKWPRWAHQVVFSSDADCKERAKFRTAAPPSIFKQHRLWCKFRLVEARAPVIWDWRCDETVSKR